jgi:hypothetical protein
MRAAIALASTLALAGCAGLPLGHHVFLMVGVGVVRVDKADQATGVSTRMVGLKLGCREITIGFEQSYCAQIPIVGDVAIIERGAGADQHLKLSKLPKETP